MPDIKTPISEARSRYRALRRKRRSLTPQDRAWYYQLRYLQNHTANWRRTRKAQLVEMATESLEAATRTLSEWNEFHAWINAQADQVSETNRPALQLICNRISDDTERLREVVDDYQDDDDVLETIVDSIVAAAQRVGLDPFEPWEDADDGAVWFINPDTGERHYFLLGQHHEGWKFEIMSRPIVSHRVVDGDTRWEQFPAVDLSSQVIPWSNPRIHHPARWLDAYFGAYNGLGIVERDLPESVDRALDRLTRIIRRSE